MAATPVAIIIERNPKPSDLDPPPLICWLVQDSIYPCSPFRADCAAVIQYARSCRAGGLSGMFKFCLLTLITCSEMRSKASVTISILVRLWKKAISVSLMKLPASAQMMRAHSCQSGSCLGIKSFCVVLFQTLA